MTVHDSFNASLPLLDRLKESLTSSNKREKNAGRIVPEDTAITCPLWKFQTINQQWCEI